MSEDRVAQLRKVIDAELPREAWTPFPGGYPGQDEAALIDAVFSIGARYGSSPDVGVRGVVGRWRAHRGSATCDDLQELANFVGRGPELAKILENEQMVAKGTKLKAEAVAEAAGNLVSVNARHSGEVAATPEQKKAYTAVKGLGWVTWEYFLMLLGIPGVKADVHITRYVSRALGSQVSPSECRTLLHAVAEQLGENPSHLDHAIWAYERAREQD